MSTPAKFCAIALVLLAGLGTTQCANYRYKEPAPAVKDPGVPNPEPVKQYQPTTAPAQTKPLPNE